MITMITYCVNSGKCKCTEAHREVIGREVIGMPSRQFRSFREFWPYYVAMHSRAPTRWVHLTGTLVGAAVTGAGATTGRRYLLPALPVLGYGAAWPPHWRIERT